MGAMGGGAPLPSTPPPASPYLHSESQPASQAGQPGLSGVTLEPSPGHGGTSNELNALFNQDSRGFPPPGDNYEHFGREYKYCYSLY